MKQLRQPQKEQKLRILNHYDRLRYCHSESNRIGRSHVCLVFFVISMHNVSLRFQSMRDSIDHLLIRPVDQSMHVHCTMYIQSHTSPSTWLVCASVQCACNVKFLHLYLFLCINLSKYEFSAPHVLSIDPLCTAC